MGTPTVHPTGTTIYDPTKAWNGYTLFQANQHGAVLIDMNGKVVKFWKDLQGMPNKLLPGGKVLGHLGERNSQYGFQDATDLVQVDWDGNIEWKFDRLEYIEDPGFEPQWMARQHHDYQREGNPVGYYVPGMIPKDKDAKTLMLCHHNVTNPKISDKELVDDCIIEIDWQGNVLWRWNAHEHFSELGFSDGAINALFRDPGMTVAGGDWMHINSMSVLGANKWYDGGDERFHPDNIIWDARQSNILAIISKATGKIVWKLGPDYDDKIGRRVGLILGQHHVHMIPRGLPGEGNILIFDNGGWAGYGDPNPQSRTGSQAIRRDFSRVLELDPVSMKVLWSVEPRDLGHLQPFQADHFYSPFISSAQRLPNGNTLITVGAGGQLMEVTTDYQIVWEYVSPYWGEFFPINMIYRAYRYPYDWVPQLEIPEEVAIVCPDNKDFRLPGAAPKDWNNVTSVLGTVGYGNLEGFCIPTDSQSLAEESNE